jgi:hypothetical protein
MAQAEHDALQELHKFDSSPESVVSDNSDDESLEGTHSNDSCSNSSNSGSEEEKPNSFLSSSENSGKENPSTLPNRGTESSYSSSEKDIGQYPELTGLVVTTPTYGHFKLPSRCAFA